MVLGNPWTPSELDVCSANSSVGTGFTFQQNLCIWGDVYNNINHSYLTTNLKLRQIKRCNCCKPKTNERSSLPYSDWDRIMFVSFLSFPTPTPSCKYGTGSVPSRCLTVLFPPPTFALGRRGLSQWNHFASLIPELEWKRWPLGLRPPLGLGISSSSAETTLIGQNPKRRRRRETWNTPGCHSLFTPPLFPTPAEKANPRSASRLGRLAWKKAQLAAYLEANRRNPETEKRERGLFTWAKRRLNPTENQAVGGGRRKKKSAPLPPQRIRHWAAAEREEEEGR